MNLATYSFILHSTKHHRHNCKLTRYSLRYGKDIPVNSQVDFGEITPTFGRTQYFLGDVVFTCQNYLAIKHSILYNEIYTKTPESWEKKKINRSETHLKCNIVMGVIGKSN